MYEKLIQALRCCADDNIPCAKCPRQAKCIEERSMNGLFPEAADAIKELSREVDIDNDAMAAMDAAMPRWIPVTERLPKDDDKRFLVCAKRFDGKPYMHICYHAKNLHEFDEYDFPTENRPGWYFYDSEYGWIEKEDVTHWMPLPEPPKKNGKSET